MTIESLTKFWPLIYSIVQEFWSITEPHIEDAAIRNDFPIELYLYSELGLDKFSIQDFQKRDPFSNPEQFERLFVRLNIKGWIEPMSDGSFRVTEKARETARFLIQAGDVQLSDFAAIPDQDLKRLLVLLKQIVLESCLAPEPPGKWAILKRFRVADEHYPPIMQIREYLMDLFAYHDDFTSFGIPPVLQRSRDRLDCPWRALERGGGQCRTNGGEDGISRLRRGGL